MNYMCIPGIPTSRSKCRPMIGSNFERDVIIKVVCEHFSISIEELIDKSRRRPIVYRRQILMFLLVYYTRDTYQEIGNIFNKDHTTVIHSKDLINDLIGIDDKVKGDVEAIKTKIIDAHY
jgi:chromosomal replication initiator protein